MQRGHAEMCLVMAWQSKEKKETRDHIASARKKNVYHQLQLQLQYLLKSELEFIKLKKLIPKKGSL